MFFGGHDDEDIDFNVTGAGGSKLASLFSSEEAKGEESKQSLTYTAPKQPRKQEGATTPSFSVLHAVAVHTFKLENQQYLGQGKLGAAILGNHEAFTYQLLLYKGQQQHVTLANISQSFTYSVQPNFYANFYDNKRDCWSIRFDTEQASVDFARQVALARSNSAGPSGPTSLVIQDLCPGQEDPLENGHSVEVKYTGWLLTNCALGQVFDSNASSQSGKKVKLGKGKVIKGWEEGLIGAKKGGRRLLVIPPALAYGPHGVPPKVPPNATLVFDIHVIKTSQSRDSRSSTPVSSQSGGEESRHSKLPPTESVASSQSAAAAAAAHDESVKARGASISEQLSQSPRSEKALLISRMAKMGTPMLPLQQAGPSSESENEDDMSSRGRRVESSPLRTISPKPNLKPRPAPTIPVSHLDATGLHSSPGIPVAAAQPQHQVALLQQQAYGLVGQPYPYAYNPQAPGPMFGAQGFPPGAAAAPMVAPAAVSTDSSHWPLLFTESRTQNSEMRITLGKISDRVDMVLSKLGELKPHPTDHVAYMESNTLLQNIQRIVQENNKLKVETEERNTKVLTLNDKISDLLQRNQKLMEDSNHWLEKRSDTFQLSSSQSQARFIALEEEKSRLSAELSEALSKLTAMQLQLQRSQAQRMSKEDPQLTSQLEEQDQLISNLQQNVRSLKTEKKDLLTRMDSLQDQLQDLQSSKETLEKSMERTQKKLLEEKRRAQEEIEDLRNVCKDEVDSLRQKLAKHKSTSPEQNEVEQLERKWEEEKGRLQKEIQELKRSLREADSLKEDMMLQVAELQSKLDASRKEKAGSNLSELKAQITSLTVWKSKYEELAATVETMKLNYDERLRNSDANRSGTPDPSVVEAKLKKAMNALYRGLQRDFRPTESYTGSQSLQMILNMIKLVTTAILEESSEEKTSLESSPTIATCPVVEEKPQPVPENTPSAAQVPQISSSPQEEEVKSLEPSLETQKDASPTQENGVPVPKASELAPQEKSAQELSCSPKSEASDDFRSSKQLSLSSPDCLDTSDKKYVFFDKKSKSWKPQPPPPPLFDEDDEEDEDDWLK